MQIHSGYKTITPIQWTNAIWALDEGLIDHRGLRTYLASFVLVAVREAADRFRRKHRGTTHGFSKYRICELERLTQLDAAKIRRALRQLERAGLMLFTEGEVKLCRETLPGSEELQSVLSCQRSARRPVPIPRSMLRFLARNQSESVTRVIIAYLVRGLSLSRTGKISGKGTVKASWIAEHFGVSERAVRYARSELVGLGWIERDRGSCQRKLNRDGAYFSINLAWSFRRQKAPCTAATTADQSLSPLVNPDKAVSNFAPLSPENCTIFAPPYKDRKTSIESKNQKPQQSEPVRSGVFLKVEESRPPDAPPTVNRILSEDLFHLGRLETLYAQAVERGWLPPSESATLNFVAAAVRAREVGRDPARVFVTIVRKSLWHHITQAQEDKARRALYRCRASSPDRFRTSSLRANVAA